MSNSVDRPLVWLYGEVRTPPLSAGRDSRPEYCSGVCSVSIRWSRPMPSIGPRCHELRIADEKATWRVVYRIDLDAIIIADVFSKKTRATPKPVIDACARRLREYDAIAGWKE